MCVQSTFNVVSGYSVYMKIFIHQITRLYPVANTLRTTRHYIATWNCGYDLALRCYQATKKRHPYYAHNNDATSRLTHNRSFWRRGKAGGIMQNHP